MRHSRFNGIVKLALCCRLETAPITIVCIEHIDQISIIPIFDRIIRAIMYFNFDGIATIIHYKDNRFQSITNNCRHFLCRQLK